MASRYGYEHQKARAAMFAEGGVLCEHCGREVGWDGKPGVADHQPPLSLHRHEEGSGCCSYVPSCATCSAQQAGALSKLVGRIGAQRITFTEPEPSPGPTDACWDAMPWLDDLREVDLTATWPRWMTQAHPLAIGSYGDDFERYCRDRSNLTLLWFQRLAARRILEHDVEGRLVWMRSWWSVARQLGKSVFGRNLLLYIADRLAQLVPRAFGADAEGNVLITSRQLQGAETVCEPEMRWAMKSTQHDLGWRTARSKGAKHIELPNGNRLLIRSVDSTYGLTVGAVLTDEAWDVDAGAYAEAVEPTVLNTHGPRWTTSTAHRKAGSFSLNLRSAAFDQLDEPRSMLMLEWGAARDRELEDRDGWREASPEWTDFREEMISERLLAAQRGEVLDPTEPDPIAAFEAQYLNRWPIVQVRAGKGEDLVPIEQWISALVTTAEPIAGRVVAIEDNYGRGLSVVLAGISRTGKVAMTGRTFESRSDGWAYVRTIKDVRSYMVGGSLMSEPQVRDLYPVTSSGAKHTRAGISTIRSLLDVGDLTHTGEEDLAKQMTEARVRESATGITMVGDKRHDLVNAASWAADEVQRLRGMTVAVH